jgi:hypothetical protein
MICTGYWIVVGGGLKYFGTNGQKKLHGLYWVMNGGGWWTEIYWDKWTREPAWIVLGNEWRWVAD